MLRAKHAFRLQTKIGEFIQFNAGQVIPEQYYRKDSPYADFIRDHSEGGIIKPQVVIPPEMARIREMPSHIKQQEEMREQVMKQRFEDNGGQQAVGSIPQKQDGAPKQVPKMEPKATPVQVTKTHKPAHKK